MRLFTPRNRLWGGLIGSLLIGISIQAAIIPRQEVEPEGVSQQFNTNQKRGGPHCTVFSFTIRPPGYNTIGREDITGTVNNGGTRNNIHFPNIAITADVTSTAITSAPGHHFITINWTNNLFRRHTVVVERFRSDQHIDNDNPDATFEVGLDAAEPGPIFDHPSHTRSCFDSPPGYKWVLQVRGPT